MSSDESPRAPIVAAFSPAAGAREPLEFGLAASRATDAPLVIAAVRHGGPVVDTATRGAVPEADAERTLEHLRTAIERRGLRDVEVRIFEDRTAARGLARALDELDPALIVVGSSHRSPIGRALLGSTAERVIHASSCPVAVVPNGYEAPDEGLRIIGAAYAPTPEGREALHLAAGLARIRGVGLRAITVHEASEAARDGVEAEVSLRAQLAELSDIETETQIVVGRAAEGLIEASERVDLLVMGSRARGPRRAVLLGSVSRTVIDHAACPVLVLPRGASARSEALLAAAAATRAAHDG
jgi:nucleotide-binding universal stress UspA family protein